VLPAHVKRLGHPGQAALEPRELKILGQLGILCRYGEVHLDEEPPVGALPVLLAGQDVRGMLDEEGWTPRTRFPAGPGRKA
jgi:hypothetical protein